MKQHLKKYIPMSWVYFKVNSCALVLILILSLILFSCVNQTNEKPIADFNHFRFLEMDIRQIQEGYTKGEFTVREVLEAYMNRIQEIDHNGPSLHSVIMVNPDALSIADKLDAELKKGKIGQPLFGIPVLIKDNIDTHDKMPCTAGSRALKNSFPLKDSYLVKKLREAGAIILGKTNLSEWANFRGQLSTSGWSGVGGQTLNPYILDRNPCGSSSGSGVAVSANLTVVAIGTETDGSIVCPAHVNGIVGIKPTVGLISRNGVIPISYTQDTPGPMARSVRDAAICLGVMTGIDSADQKTQTSNGKFYTDYTQFLKENGLKGKRIGYYKGYQGINFKVDHLMEMAVSFMKSKGAEIIELDKLHDTNTDNSELEVMLYEYKDGLNKYFASLGPGATVKSIEELIEFNKRDSVELKYFNQYFLEMAQKKGNLNSKEYIEMLGQLRKGSQDEGIDKVMNENRLDAIIAPTGCPAWKTDWINGDSYQYGSSSFAAQAGYPNITVPMGFVEKLPVGISFFGRAWSEPVLLEIAYAYEVGTKHRKIPEFLISDH